MTMEEIKGLVSPCMESQNFDDFDLLENSLLEGDFSLNELNLLCDELYEMTVEKGYLADESFSKNNDAIAEYEKVSQMLEQLDRYEKDKKNIVKKLILPSIATMITTMAYKIVNTSDLKDLLISFSSVILSIATVGSVTYNRRRMSLIGELEKIGDLDELFMKRYDALEREKTFSTMAADFNEQAKLAYICQLRVENVIDEKEEEEEVKEFVKS